MASQEVLNPRHLPDEVLIRILTIALVTMANIYIVSIDEGSYSHAEQALTGQVLRVSRRFADLGLPILYGRNTFTFDVDRYIYQTLRIPRFPTLPLRYLALEYRHLEYPGVLEALDGNVLLRLEMWRVALVSGGDAAEVLLDTWEVKQQCLDRSAYEFREEEHKTVLRSFRTQYPELEIEFDVLVRVTKEDGTESECKIQVSFSMHKVHCRRRLKLSCGQVAFAETTF